MATATLMAIGTTAEAMDIHDSSDDDAWRQRQRQHGSPQQRRRRRDAWDGDDHISITTARGVRMCVHETATTMTTTRLPVPWWHNINGDDDDD